MNKKITLELVWWVFTAVVVALVMLPIWKDFPLFPYQITNIFYIAAFVTFARYTFFLRYTFIAEAQYFKIGFVLVTLAIIGTLIFEMQDFQVWIDKSDPDQLLIDVAPAKRESLLSYIKSEFIFFAVGSVVSALFLSARLLFSIWRLRNRGKA